MRHALIRDGIVQTVILWDGETPYAPPENCVLLPCPDPVDANWSYDGDWHEPPAEAAD